MERRHFSNFLSESIWPMVRTVLQTTLTRTGNMPSGRLAPLPQGEEVTCPGVSVHDEGGAKNAVFIGIEFLASETVRTVDDNVLHNLGCQRLLITTTRSGARALSTATSPAVSWPLRARKNVRSRPTRATRMLRNFRATVTRWGGVPGVGGRGTGAPGGRELGDGWLGGKGLGSLDPSSGDLNRASLNRINLDIGHLPTYSGGIHIGEAGRSGAAQTEQTRAARAAGGPRTGPRLSVTSIA